MSRGLNWLQEGRDVGVTLDACNAIVVVGSDPTATSEVALGIARVQAQHRRVAVGDMFGDAPPLHGLVDSDDPHGLMDSFLYGVSLNRIAHLVPDSGELYVMPSGTGPLDYDELFLHPRWRRLAAGFREMGALLLIAAPAEATHIRELVEATDGAVLVGETVPMDLPVALSLAWVRPRRTAVIPAPGLVPAAASTPQGVTEPVVRRAERRFGPALGGIAIAALLVFALVWFARRPFASTPKPHRGVTAASPAAATVTGGALGADGVARARQEQATRDSIARAASAYVPTDSFPATEVTNPGDSANASAFAVKLEEVFTPAGAILNLQQKYKSVPAGTYNRDPRSRFLIEVAGAYPTKAGADSLLQQLTARGLLGLGVGTVVSVPYAFMVKQDVPLSEAAARVTHYVTGPGKPVYALRQANGTATLYFGAYASPQQAALAIPDVKGLGIKPTLVYRTGRVF